MRATMMLLLLLVPAVPAMAAPLTADDAVKIALQHSSEIVQAKAGQYTAKSGMWSAYAGVLPSASASLSRSGSFTGESRGFSAGNVVVASPPVYDQEGYSLTRGVSGSWPILNLSSWTSWSSARLGVRAADYSLSAARANVVLSTKRQFYTVVQAMHQAVVNAQALRLARDSERRVRAMYEVGSVSKSDLLKAQVATSQAELDSLTADHAVTQQRILLAQALGVPEAQIGDVDSTFDVTQQTVDPEAILAEARRNRPDLRAAEADARSSELDLRAARWERLPYVSLSGSWTPKSTRTVKSSDYPDGSNPSSSSSETERTYAGTVSVNLPLFDGLATDARVANARGRMMEARETRDALLRNLEGEVHQAVLAYREAVERIALGSRTVESASENLNLVQQKYNVGSATILDLIDSQVQFQSAQSTLVAAQAAIRIAEAQLDQVRGRSQ